MILPVEIVIANHRILPWMKRFQIGKDSFLLLKPRISSTVNTKAHHPGSLTVEYRKKYSQVA